MRSFRSDNNAALCPEALQAFVDANDGVHRAAYGDDVYTEEAREAFCSLFGDQTSVWFVATGTAANTLAVASMTEPWEQVLCHCHSHYHDDESTAPERITGCRTTAIHTESAKLTPQDLRRAGVKLHGGVHQPQPGVVTISNPTELGVVYTPAETAALCTAAHELGFRVHVDGARFANAVASVGCDPADLGPAAGVDAMSFGGTKNGLAWGEAVLLFPQGDGSTHRRAIRRIPHLRKSTGHLLSKHRFVAAPFAAVLAGDAWLRHAAHANSMARRLSAGLGERGIRLGFPTEANAVLAEVHADLIARLQAAGHGLYGFGDPAWGLSRLMASFDTTPEDVDALLCLVTG